MKYFWRLVVFLVSIVIWVVCTQLPQGVAIVLAFLWGIAYTVLNYVARLEDRRNYASR